jgi:hypothetical protein
MPVLAELSETLKHTGRVKLLSEGQSNFYDVTYSQEG